MHTTFTLTDAATANRLDDTLGAGRHTSNLAPVGDDLSGLRVGVVRALPAGVDAAVESSFDAAVGDALQRHTGWHLRRPALAGAAG